MDWASGRDLGDAGELLALLDTEQGLGLDYMRQGAVHMVDWVVGVSFLDLGDSRLVEEGAYAVVRGESAVEHSAGVVVDIADC